MSGPSPIVKTRLKGVMHTRFLAEREARGISESELLRLALHHFFSKDRLETTSVLDQAIGATQTVVAPTPEQARLHPKTVWLPAFLIKLASEQAEGKGMSFSRWMCSLVQSNLTRLPVLSDQELLMLENATRELAAIGRNINQIARAVNEAYFQVERIRLDKLAELSAKITTTRRAIRALIRASRRSWRSD